ncbi:uncharacterized protein LOC114515893 [Dendronephthya gigantea]|uniref:uncharacterized protein LOC114515893 n=1 Tax=Dendronephthya gigantea TaxID=151771 RepID=UPI001069D4C7|nr:uncharacterized protein LOC114515893 [Dendronephthya gigantea]
METSTLSVTFAFVCVFFVFCKAETGKPYYVKKSSLCSIDQNEVCTSKNYDFYAIVIEVVADIKEDKLSKKGKDTVKDSGICANALKEAICSNPSRNCYEGNDESRAKEVCGKLRRNCPLLLEDSFDEYEEGCVEYLHKSVFTDLTCVANDPDERFKGYCPKPSGKMPAAYWKAYIAKSEELEEPMKYVEYANKFTSNTLVSNDCMRKIKDTVCVPLYCTEDEKSIIVPNLEDKCDEVLECINKIPDKYSKLSTLLEPIKRRLKKGCTKIVEFVKTGKVSGNAAQATLNVSIGLNALVIITIIAPYLY